MYEVNWIDMNWVDYGIIAIISISILFGIVRGFVREAMSLVTWVAAITVAYLYREPVAAWFTSISIDWVRLVLAVVLLILFVLIIGGVISHLMAKVIKITKFSITDRIVGALFGLAKGIVIVAILVLFILLINPVTVIHDPLWQKSVLIPEIEPIALRIKEKLPEHWLKYANNPNPQPKEEKKVGH